MIKQNKGEWSELYVFLKLLGDGVLYAADADLNKIEDLYYPLIEILRKENKQINHYVKDDINIKIVDNLQNLLLELPVIEFEEKARILLHAIQEAKGTFAVSDIESFMNIIKCTKVKADSMNKSDIVLVLHDCKTYRNETFGFSIKSRLGGAPTLLNTGVTNNFTFVINGNLSTEDIRRINNIDTASKIKDRIQDIYRLGYKLEFVDIENVNFNSNLQMIDSKFPEIAAAILLQRYFEKDSSIRFLTEKITECNPCNFNNTNQNHYEYKIKTFLTAVALGMTSANPWNGMFQATGGYITVKENGEVLCYHIYNQNEFREYLFNNTRLETPSTSRYDFGYIYSKNGKNYIKLNLQIRFI